MSIYKDPILVKLRDLFIAEGPKELKDRYGFGDSLQVNKGVLPFAFMSIDIQRVTNSSNAEITTDIPIVVNVVYDMTRDFNQSLENVQSHMSVVNMLIGRNPDYTIRKDSLAGVLWSHEQLADNLWVNLGQQMEADFGIGIEKRGPGIYTTEGVLRFTVKHQQIRPDLLQQ